MAWKKSPVRTRPGPPIPPTQAARSRSKNCGPFSRKSSSDGNCLSLALVIRVPILLRDPALEILVHHHALERDAPPLKLQA